MRSKVTVVLLFLNVVLFFYIFRFEEKWRAERATLEARRRVLPAEIASLESFTRTTSDGATVKLEKKGDAWWLTAPYEWPANPNAVSRLHNELQFLEHETSFLVADLPKSGQTLADYGLAEPALTVDLTAAGKSFRLLIGADTRTGNRLYLLSPDTERIHVVSRSLAESVGMALADLRTDTLFTIPVFEVRSLNIQTGPPSNLKVRLRRDNASRWGFETPILARANKANVEVTINALNALTAKSFLDRSEADRTGLDSPSLRVTFEGNARRETLLLGSAATPGEYYARFEDKNVVFTTAVPAHLLEVLRASQDELRDRHVLDFDPATVTSLNLRAPNQPALSLQKLETAPASGGPAVAAPAPGAWQLITRADGQAPVTTAADPDVIRDLLGRLERLSVVKFLSDAPSAADVEKYGFTEPEREITLGLTTGGGLDGRAPSTLVLQVGVDPGTTGTAFARLTNPPFVYEILPDIIEDTPVLARHFRHRLLRKLPEGALLTTVSLVDLTTGTPVFAQKIKEGEQTWTATLAATPEATRPALAAILAQLTELRAAAFTADAFSPDHADTPEGNRPWRYRLDYSVTFNGGPEIPASLLLTERLGGMTLVAGTADFGGVVFTVTQPLLDALFALTYTATQDPGPVEPAAASPAPAAPKN
ncbi:hypothetical protein Verru16b_00138 [Lacunisphaera limnophila]|uniref:DUF4340 domain-containing protein n=1 Tax=Lacunisphaera limnophila TaxID=1838286 RepID=A0A1I7PHL1_9BACT|nr:DUF4340 domain-containing protein [Lacunisphaera limnophila]AOS43097.1 hypothetical protein Verru16b_00138 [Lacunisphaera limnophila]